MCVYILYARILLIVFVILKNTKIFLTFSKMLFHSSESLLKIGWCFNKYKTIKETFGLTIFLGEPIIINILITSNSNYSAVQYLTLNHNFLHKLACNRKFRIDYTHVSQLEDMQLIVGKNVLKCWYYCSTGKNYHLFYLLKI